MACGAFRATSNMACRPQWLQANTSRQGVIWFFFSGEGCYITTRGFLGCQKVVLVFKSFFRWGFWGVRVIYPRDKFNMAPKNGGFQKGSLLSQGLISGEQTLHVYPDGHNWLICLEDKPEDTRKRNNSIKIIFTTWTDAEGCNKMQPSCLLENYQWSLIHINLHQRSLCGDPDRNLIF